MKGNNKIVPYELCSWILLIVFCMQFVVSFCIKKFCNIFGIVPNEYEYILFTQLFSVILPCLFACLFSGADFTRACGFKKISLFRFNNSFALGFCLQPVAILAGIYWQNVVGTGQSIVSPPDSLGSFLLTVLVVSIIPAFCEEMLLRGMLLNSLRRRGYVFSIFATTVIFTVLHGSVYSLPGYIFLGIGAAFAVLNTNSVFAGMAVHFGFNLCGVLIDWLLNSFYTPDGFLGSMNFYKLAGIVGGVLAIVFAVCVNNRRIKKYASTDAFKNLWEVFVNVPIVLIFVIYIFGVVL